MIKNQRSCKLLNCVCSFTILFFNHYSISRQFALRQSLGELKRSRGGESMCQKGWKRKMCQRKRKRRKLRRKLRRGWSRKKSTGPWYRSPPLDSNHSIFPPHVPVLSCTPITSFSTQDLELLLSHREEIEKIQNFVADLQSAGLQGRVL